MTEEHKHSSACAVCGVPLAGPLGAALRLAGVTRSAQNPNCCTRCNLHIEAGGLVEITVVFADVTGFTEMTRTLGAEKTYEIVDAFLRQATEIIVRRGGFVDKYIGDAIMAFFNVPLKSPDHRARALAAAAEIQARVGELSARFGRPLSAGIGVASGHARIGRLGSNDKKDFTAIGDAVNMAARLEAQARGGETVVMREVYDAAAAGGKRPAVEVLSLKGFADPVPAYRLGAGDGAPAPAPAAAAPELVPSAASWGSVLLALAGAGCAGSSVAGVVASFLGAGALTAALSGLTRWMDSSPLRFPLVAAAAVLGLSGLAGYARARRDRARWTTLERRQARFALAASLFALASALFEILMHFHENGSVFR
jgi:adenylate cyclase